MRGVSADGSIVVGMATEAPSSEGGRGSEPFIWDADHGMRNLTDVLRDEYGLGESLAGWNLGEAEDISDDGRTIVGLGNQGPWIAYLGTPVPEPSTLALVIVALCIAPAFALRRSSRFRSPRAALSGR